MAKASSADITIEFDNASDALQDISSEVLSINGFPMEALTEEAHGYGAAWVFSETVGMTSMGDITIQVFYDDSATSAYAYLNSIGDTRTLKVTIGSGGPYKSAEVIIAAFNIVMNRGELVKGEATLRLASTVTEG